MSTETCNQDGRLRTDEMPAVAQDEHQDMSENDTRSTGWRPTTNPVLGNWDSPDIDGILMHLDVPCG